VRIDEFNAARMAEDVAVADGLQTATRIPGQVPDFTAAGGPAAEAYWQQFDPARMLHGLDALQRILTRHAPDEAGLCQGCADELTGGWVEIDDCPEQRSIASIWIGHPEYQRSWHG
jgi:hypothetical protein